MCVCVCVCVSTCVCVCVCGGGGGDSVKCKGSVGNMVRLQIKGIAKLYSSFSCTVGDFGLFQSH